MSYYQVTPGSYYTNPGPVYGPGGDFGAPVPGWGALPNMAGPARIGVGAHGLGQVKAKATAIDPALLMSILQTQRAFQIPEELPPEDGAPPTDEGIPWWAPLAAAGGLSVVAVVAFSRGWI